MAYLFKRDNGRYYIQEKKNGKITFTKSTGTKNFNKADTIFKEKYLRDPDKFISFIKATLTFNEFTVIALDHYRTNHQPSTVKLYKRIFKFFPKVCGDKNLLDYSPKDIEKYKKYRLLSVSKSTVNIDIRNLKSLFNLAVYYNYIPISPIAKAKLLSITQKEHLAFDDLQMKTIIDNISDYDLLNFVTFASLTGARYNEIIHLEWKDVEKGVIYIRNKPNFKTKSGKIRIFPLSDKIKSLLDSMNRDDTYIFYPGRKRSYLNHRISGWFKSHLRSLGFDEKFHFHCIRHYVATKLIEAGVDIYTVKDLLGHSVISTTEKYIHSNPVLRVDAANLL